MRVAGYVRVSTQEQTEHGYSVSEQCDRIAKYCEAKGWELVHTYIDGGYSGAKLDRPGMQQLISECAKYDMVLVYKLDRLSRSQKDTLYLIEEVFKNKGVDFSSMQENFDTSTPLGMAMIGILSVFAQLEREQIKERMQLGKDGRIKEGHWSASHAPIGYKYVPQMGDVKGHLEINEADAEIVREIFDKYIAGWTMYKIVQYTYQRYPGPHWRSTSNIRHILEDPVYCGDMIWKGKRHKGNHDPIISRETFEIAQDIRNRSKGHNNGRTLHMLTGIVYCGECGGRMYYENKGGNYKYYRCGMSDMPRYINGKTKCNSKAIRAEKLESEVTNTLRKLKMTEIKEKKAPDHSKQIASINRQIERAAQLYTVEGMDIETIKKMIADLTAKRNALQAPENPSVTAVNRALRNINDVLDSDDMQLKINAIRAIVDRVVVTGQNIDIHFTF